MKPKATRAAKQSAVPEAKVDTIVVKPKTVPKAVPKARPTTSGNSPVIKLKLGGPTAFPMDVDSASGSSGTRAVPISRKRSALGQPIEDAPTASKLAKTSQGSLAPRRQTSQSSLSSLQIIDSQPRPSSSRTFLGAPPTNSSPADMLLMRLNTLEEAMRRNHADALSRMDEIRRMIVEQLGPGA